MLQCCNGTLGHYMIYLCPAINKKKTSWTNIWHFSRGHLGHDHSHCRHHCGRHLLLRRPLLASIEEARSSLGGPGEWSSVGPGQLPVLHHLAPAREEAGRGSWLQWLQQTECGEQQQHQQHPHQQLRCQQQLQEQLSSAQVRYRPSLHMRDFNLLISI